ncbi:MAG: hypothetical protein ACK5LN_08995 [Propioniciclava sp.]
MKLNARIALATALSLGVFGWATPAQASPGYHTARSSYTQKSIVGIPVYKMGISADYYGNRSRITDWYDTKAETATFYPGWTVTSKSAKWTRKGKTKGTARAWANFFYGLDTQWVKLGIQSYDETIKIHVRR